MKFKLNTLFTKALAAISIALFPPLVSFLFSYHSSERHLRDHLLNDLAVIAEAHESHLYQFLESMKNRTIDFSTDGFILDRLPAAARGDRSAQRELTAHLIRNKKPIDGTLDGITLTGPDGKIVASTDLNAVGASLAASEAFISARQNSPSLVAAGPWVMVATTVRKDRESSIRGVMINRFSLKRLQDVLTGVFLRDSGAISWKAGRPKTMDIYLVNQERLMITSSTASATIDDTSQPVVDTLPVTACLSENKEVLTFYPDYRGNEVAGASMCIPILHWTLVVEASAEEVYSPPIRAMRRNTLTATAAVFGMLGALFFLFFRTIVDPLRRMAAAAGQVAAGVRDIAIPVKSGDEVGDLARSFNDMAAQIGKRTDELRASEEKYRTILDNINEIIYRVRIGDGTWEQNLEFVSAQSYRIAGFTPEEFLADAGLWFRLVHPDDVQALARTTEAIIQSRASGTRIYRLRRKDRDDYIWIEDKMVPETDRNGRVVGCWGVARDVTQRRNAEEQLRMKEQAIASSINAIMITDLEGSISYVNASFLRMWKFPAGGDALNRPSLDLWQDRDRAKDVMQRLRERGTWRGELTGLRKDGSPFDVQLTANVVADAEGRPHHLLASCIDVTESKQTERALAVNAARLSLAQRIARLGTWEWNIVTNELWWSDQIYEIFGLRPREFTATFEAFLSRVHPDDLAIVKTAVEGSLANGMPYDIDHRILLPDGRIRHVHEQGTVHSDASGKPVRMIGTVQDITSRMKAEAEIRKLSAVIEHSVNIVLITDRSGRIEYVNPTFERVTGWTREEAIGKNPSILASGETTKEEYTALWKTILAGRTWRSEYRNKRKDGSLYWASSVITPILDEQGEISRFLAVQEDITERREAEERLGYLAVHDELTGLINRTRFMELIETWLQAYDMVGTGAGILLLIDIDEFKYINDTYGHATGDVIIKEVGALFKRQISDPSGKSAAGLADALLARMGGDEFALFLPNVGIQDGMAIAEKLRVAVETYRPIEGNIRITVSIGMVAHPEHGRTAKDLFTRVDAALYRTKRTAKNRIHLYRPEDQDLEHIHTRLHQKERILKAMAEDRLHPWFQPILDLKTGAVHHYEALARMQDENGTILTPGDFIETAEMFGLISAIDRIITRKTMEKQAEAGRRGTMLSFGMNLSGKELGDEELLTFLKQAIVETGADPACLVFEITETAAVHDLKQARRFINSLKEAGCRFSLDDFGVGFTSFVYLRELSVDYIKIDGSFIRNLGVSNNDRLFVRAITDVAAGMGIKTIAEFVETEETLGLIRQLGVDYAQGYLIGVPATELLP